MIEKQRSELFIKDERGAKSQIRVEGVQFDGVEIVECPKGKVRGNHYHKVKNEYLHVFSGSVEIETLDSGNNEQKITLVSGDYIVIPPLTKHRITGLDDAVLIIPFQGSSSIEDSYEWK